MCLCERTCNSKPNSCDVVDCTNLQMCDCPSGYQKSAKGGYCERILHCPTTTTTTTTTTIPTTTSTTTPSNPTTTSCKQHPNTLYTYFSDLKTWVLGCLKYF